MKPHNNSAMRVVLLGYMHGRGGIQTHTRFLAEGLRERGHEVTIVSPAPMRSHGHEDTTEGVHIYNGLADLVRIVRGAEPDVAVATGTGWASMLGVLAAGRSCKKVFFEVMSGARPAAFDPRVLSRFGFDAIVGQGSPVTRRFMKEFSWRGPSETIPALPEPLERQFTIPARKLRSVKKGVRFAYFGRFGPAKNVRLLIERFEDYAGSKGTLDIWGGGSDADELAKLIKDSGLADRITMKGRYPEGQAYIGLLQDYDLMLLPTVAEEGAPLVLLEAMACGLPFVANGMGGIPDYTNPDSIITENGDITDFIPSVVKMVERLESADVDLARLQKHYADHFSFVRLVDRWEAFLLTLAKPE
ncbi:glycosyltransferase [Erythrobacter sp. F6033]|uniref:glycosyltransferase n=1 Tax=Erythrobacter sp. F6033 TaxID=2926401 RepID=UPI001FF643CC|nr:glycosyltransferase [Erythrobacter sp. F6033]MCK0129802.1 glycosyltransferase [Erythrobacter sp. F6033]